MVEPKQKIQKEIESLHKTIQEWEDTDYLYRRPRLKKLRDRVWYIYERMSSTLDLFIIHGLYSFVKPKLDVVGNALALVQLEKLFSGAEFGVRISAAERLGVLGKELTKRYREVNEVRKQFAHPDTYKKEMDIYSTDVGELKVLKVLERAMKTLDSVVGDKSRKA